MEPILTTIGEYDIQIVCQSDSLMTWIQRNFPANVLAKAKPDLFIHLIEGYGVPFVDYNVEIVKTTSNISFHRADYLIETDLDYHHAKVSVHNELALKHALMNLFSSFLVRRQWGLIIHSSCVVEQGKAHIFAGHSGAGKSTAAKLSSPRELLSDEATLVKISPNEIVVYNSPFRSELDVTHAGAYCPLASIQLLKQSQTNSRTSMGKSSGLLHLMDKVFYWTQDPEETRTIMNLLAILAEAIPIYELRFQKNDTFWELMS
ncbi:hypothetical protein ACFQ88_06520 [Paenibacillus sp. NPDC056579]|uniref:hypothetical protein n=1 Tax=Paenibacillus sp. NPDC056579 TaxID=3345871 RepID=UPI0036A73EBC